MPFWGLSLFSIICVLLKLDSLFYLCLRGGGDSPLKTMKRGENMEQWLSVIGEVGFPIVVTLYLLNRIESKLDALNHSIQMLPSQLGRL